MLCDHSGGSRPDTTEGLARAVNTPKSGRPVVKMREQAPAAMDSEAWVQMRKL